MNMSQTAKVPHPRSLSANVGEVNSFGISHEGIFNLSAAIDEDSHLASNFTTDARKVARQLGGDDSVGGYLSAKRSAERFFLVRL